MRCRVSSETTFFYVDVSSRFFTMPTDEKPYVNNGALIEFSRWREKKSPFVRFYRKMFSFLRGRGFVELYSMFRSRDRLFRRMVFNLEKWPTSRLKTTITGKIMLRFTSGFHKK